MGFRVQGLRFWVVGLRPLMVLVMSAGDGSDRDVDPAVGDNEDEESGNNVVDDDDNYDDDDDDEDGKP